MSRETRLLGYWRDLPTEAQDQILETARSLQEQIDRLGPDYRQACPRPKDLRPQDFDSLNSLHRDENANTYYWDQKREQLLQQLKSLA